MDNQTQGSFRDKLTQNSPKSQDQNDKLPSLTPHFLKLIPEGLPKGLPEESEFSPILAQYRIAPTMRPSGPPAPIVIPKVTTFQPEPIEQIDIIHALTSCLDNVVRFRTAIVIYRTLFQLGLFSLMARGLPSQHVTKVCFHLPVELLAAYLQIDRTTVWRNIKCLKEAGILDYRDHYGTLRGETAVTGKLWALSLQPDRVLAGKRDKVKVTYDDLTEIKWRDLEADARQGRTVYALLKEEKAKQERAKAEQEKLAAKQHFLALQQSLNTLQVGINLNILKAWVLAPFSQNPCVTLTVAEGLKAHQCGLDAIWAIPALTGLPKAQRGLAVEELAGKLAVTYQDGQNAKFWAWLLWQTLRAYDQGHDTTEDVCAVLARVFHDLKHEPARKAAAVVVNELKATNLYQFLKDLPPTRVGAKPKAA